MEVNKEYEWVLANANAIILAIIVALVIRHYCLEAFKIPSTSMEPVLIGDPRCGDRILVHKNAYLFSPPSRWDVVIFEYPNDHSRNFIKRLIALPGEQVQIKNGNIYVNNKIIQKPPIIQNKLLYPVFDYRNQRSKEFWGSYKDDAKWLWSDNFTVKIKSEPLSWCNYLSQINDKYVPKHDNLFFNRAHRASMVGGRNDVGEVSLQFSVKISKGTDILVQFRDGRNIVKCNIGSNNILQWYTHEEQKLLKQIKIPQAIPPNKQTILRLSNLDNVVQLFLDNQLIATLQLEIPIHEAPDSTYESSVQLGIQHGEASFSKFQLWRDVYYIGEENLFAASKVWNVPQNHYFFLGDNPPNSRDSRDWERFSVFLKNGIALHGDQSVYPDGEEYKFTDLYGIKRTIPQEQFKDSYLSNISVPFVHKDLIQGRAFMVFWPPPRIKVIR